MVQPILVFFTPARMILPIPVYLGAFRRGPTHPRIFSMRLDANGEGYDPSLCIFDVINANTTTTTKPTPFVGYYCTPGGGREERSSCLYVHHFFLSFLKTYFASATRGFPPSVFTKRTWKVSDGRKSFRHRHLSRVPLLVIIPHHFGHRKDILWTCLFVARCFLHS